MAETFDAVLAEGREEIRFRLMVRGENNTDRKLAELLDRLAAAHAAEVAERDARLNGEKFAHEQTKRALAEATETWTDDAGNAWRPATAWAYAQSCRVRDELRARAEAAERDARRKCADAVPSNWCDPLLTGPNAVLRGNGGTWGCPDIERLLAEIKARIDACIGGGEGK